MTSDDLAVIDGVERRYEAEIRDFNRFWYLIGHRFQYQPFAGYVNAPFQSRTLNISPQGFRGAEIKKRNVHGKPRIAVFGSSAVVGIPNSNDDNVITAYAARRCEANGLEAEVMNFGVISARIGNEMRLIVKFLTEFDIDVVVLLSGWNDGAGFTLGSLWEYQDVADIQLSGFELNRHRDAPWYFLGLAMKAVRRRLEMSRVRRAAATLRGAEKYFRRKRAKRLDHSQTVPVFEAGERIYLQFLRQIVAACQYAGKPFIYVFQPTLFTTAKSLSAYEKAACRSQNNFFGQDPEQQKARILEFTEFYKDLGKKCQDLVRREGGIVFNPEARFAETSPDVDVFYDESHYFMAGKRIIGDGIADAARKALA